MKGKSAILSLAVLLCFSVPANAVLIDRGTGMIYDTELGITWLQDANYAHTSGYWDSLSNTTPDDWPGRMNWYDSMLWVDQLTYGGYNDWRLPSILNSEMRHLYFNDGIKDTTPGPFLNVQDHHYWSSTEYNPNNAWCVHFTHGSRGFGGKIDLNYAWAVRDGDYGPSVTTTETYLTDYFTLGDTFTFDYWWEMGIEPKGSNFDVLFFNGTEWETFGWELNFGGSSTEWETASFWVPPWLRGQDVQIKFSLFDWGQETDPTVYLRNIGSAQVPEPATIILLGTGLIGLAAGASRKKSYCS